MDIEFCKKYYTIEFGDIVYFFWKDVYKDIVARLLAAYLKTEFKMADTY